MKFSVLLSIYHKEKPEYFNRAMQSIWEEQTVQPDEIVLVLDGPLPKELMGTIERWQQTIGEKLKQIPLAQNVGLGEALNQGLHACSHNLVARMDTDDIAIPKRFETQLEVFADERIDICGSWISEFESDETLVESVRKVPQYHADIVHFAQKRNPMNHPSVMYRKDAVLKTGGYRPMLWFEDYYLWVRMLQSGAQFYNIQTPLVHMRAGTAQLERRRGIAYAKQEFFFQRELRRIRFINTPQMLLNLITRIGVRMLPKQAVASLYRNIRRMG